MKHLTNIDLNKNELQNALMHKLASAPGSPVEGQLYHDTTTHHLFFRTNSAWFDVTDALTFAGNAEALYARLAGPAFSGAPTAPTAAPGTNTTQIATTAFTIAEIAARIAAADAMVYKGVIDCSANPNYPAADAGWTYKVSVAGKIGGASGPNVEVGDTLLCLVDTTASGTQAGVGANWDIIQTNIDGAVVGPASVTSGNPTVFSGTTGKVIAEITFAAFKTSLALVKADVGLGNVDNTSDANKPVSTAQQTALNLKADLAGPAFSGVPTTPTAAPGTNTTQLASTAFVAAAAAAISQALKFSADVGDGAATSYVITHNLNTRDVHVALRSNSTPWEKNICDVEMTSVNTVTLRFAVAPTPNQFRVTILG